MMMVPGAPSASSTNSGKHPSRSASGVAAGRFSGHASASSAKAPAPSRLFSSQVVSSTVMSGRGAPDSNTERSPSKMAVMPALSSAERIVSPAEQTTSAMRQVTSSQIWRCSMTASMPAQGFTVSRCAENPMRPGTVPGKCAMRLPVSDPVSAAEASKVTVNPISASFSAQ